MPFVFCDFYVSYAFLSFLKAEYIGSYSLPLLINILLEGYFVYKGSPPTCEKQGGGLPPFSKICQNAAFFPKKRQKKLPRRWEVNMSSIILSYIKKQVRHGILSRFFRIRRKHISLKSVWTHTDYRQ